MSMESDEGDDEQAEENKYNLRNRNIPPNYLVNLF